MAMGVFSPKKWRGKELMLILLGSVAVHILIELIDGESLNHSVLFVEMDWLMGQ